MDQKFLRNIRASSAGGEPRAQMRGKEIDKRADMRGLPDLLTDDQPQLGGQLRDRGKATHQVRLAVAHEAGQRTDPQSHLQRRCHIGEAVAAGADARVRSDPSEPHERRQICQCSLDTDDGVPVDLIRVARDPMLLRIDLAAIERPGRVGEALRDDAATLRPRARTHRDVGLAAREVEPAVVGDQLDRDAGILLAERLQTGRDDAIGVSLARREAHRAGDYALLCGDRAL